MKKTFFALAVFMFICSVCFAEVLSSGGTNNTANATSTNATSTNATSTASPSPAPSQIAETPSVPNTTTPVSTPAPVAAPAATPSFTGKVISISLGSEIAKTQSQMTVKDDNGKDMVFTIPKDAKIFDKEGNPTSLNWISSGDKISVESDTGSDGTQTVKSIKRLSNF